MIENKTINKNLEITTTATTTTTPPRVTWKDVPKFQELPNYLKKKLLQEFSVYVLKQVKFRHWVMFFSFWALAFQSDKLLDSYLEFDTVVKVEIKKPEYIDLPGVTICTDKYHMVIRQKLMARYPQIEEQIKERNLTKEEDIIVLLREWKQFAYQNSTVDEWFRLMADPWMIMDCKMIMNPKYYKDRDLPFPTCYNISEILYTLPHGSGICWIFFSQVNPRDYHTKDWVDAHDWYKIEVELGIIASYHLHYKAFDENWFVYDEMPDTIDNIDKEPEIAAIVNYAKAVYPYVSLDRATLKKGTNYEVNFAQTNAKLLNAPYHTDCRRYEEEGYWKQYKSNYHCIDGCLDKYMKRCNCIFNVSRGERITLWPADDHWSSKVKFCDSIQSWDDKDVCRSANAFVIKFSESECQLRKACKNHCREEYYRYEVKQLYWDEEIDGKGMPENDDDDYFYERGLPEYPKAKVGDNFSTLRIKRKDVTDVTYEHTAEMIFVEFVCYFGGLLGLWLGVSILDVYHQCLIWNAEAPGIYKIWLERQNAINGVHRIKIQANGKISIITDHEFGYQQTKGSIIKRMPSVDNFKTEYGTSFGTQFSNNY